jgi:hypothetical protein
MEQQAILRFKKPSNQGGPVYYYDTLKTTKKNISTKSIRTTNKLEEAKIFISFGMAGLAAQHAEMNMQFEPVTLEQASMDEVARLRQMLDLASKN